METIYEPITQAGLHFQQFLQQISSLQSLHIQISLETINSLFCPGVSNQNVEIGLTAEEIIEIMFQVGKNKNIKSLGICDYNPTVEDYRTGRLVANMIYYCLLGFKGFRK
jgi:formiminoglutamase